MNGYNVMDAKEVIKKFREEVHPFVLTRVVDTGEYYVAFVCTRGGRCTYEAQYSMSYDGKMGRVQTLEPEIHEKVKNGTILYENYGRIEARKRLLAKGYDV